MKKLFFAFMVIFVSSCSVDENSIGESKKTRIEEIKNEKDISVQRVMYNLLTPSEKYQLWSNKIDDIIKDKSLNNEQINLIKEVKSKLNKNYFDDSYSDDNKEIFKVVYLKNFLKKLQVLFSDEFIYFNFYTINSKKALDTSISNCSCYTGTTFWSCGVISPYTCKTPTDPCTIKDTGCGLWWQDSCDGKCQ